MEHIFNHYSFGSLWNPELIVVTIVSAIIYFTLTGSLRLVFTDSTPVRFGKKMLFFTGLIIFYLALGSPLHIIGDDFLFSGHILQQAFVYIFMPPLLLLGTPAWILRPLLQRRVIKNIMWFLTHPFTALLFFNVLFSFYHFPAIFDTVHANDALHNFTHTILLFAAFIMWWPIISPLPEWNRLSELQKIAYIVGNGILLYPACALIILADSVMYTTYVGAPQLLTFLPSLQDQQLGGVMMKIIQEMALGMALTYTFYHWVRKEKSQDTMDMIEPAKSH